MTMAPTDQELEGIPEEEEPQETPEKNPNEERFAKLEAQLGEVAGHGRRLENQLGYIGRQLTQLASQPHTAVTEAKVDRLMEQLEAIRLGSMDADEKVAYYQKQREEAASHKAETEANPVSQASVVDVLAVEYQTVHAPKLFKYAAKQGVDFPTAARAFPSELHVSRDDPTGWVAFNEAAEKVIDDLADEKQRQKEKPVRTDTTRGGSAPKGGLEAYKQALKQGQALPSATDIDRLTAKYATA